jgi:polysaccharide pyruvyl transferase WcaK-like protein
MEGCAASVTAADFEDIQLPLAHFRSETKPERRKVVLIGGAGGPNFGDELIVKGWIEYFKSRPEQYDLIFLENRVEDTKELMLPWLVRRDRCSFSDKLIKVANSVVDLEFWQQVERGWTFFERHGPKHHASPLWDHLLEADTIHLHGGGYLNDMGPEKGFLLGLAAAVKRQRPTIRLVATGIGFGPVRGDPKGHGPREAIGMYDLFEVRDAGSMRALKSRFPHAALHLGLDDCYLLPVDRLVTRTDRPRTLHLSFIAYNVGKFGDTFWSRLSDIAAEMDRVIFWQSYPFQDKAVFEFVSGRFPRLELVTVAQALSGDVTVTPADLAVTARFHVHFVLARAGLSGWFLRDTDYYRAKHDSITLRGSSFRLGDKSLSGPPASGSSAIALTDAVHVAQKRATADWIYNR